MISKIINPKVFVDTNILKFSANKQLRLVPKKEIINWKGETYEITIHDIKITERNNNINNPYLKKEANLIREIATASKENKIILVVSSESLIESHSLPDMDCVEGNFFGAEFDTAKPPFPYKRITGGHMLPSSKDIQYEFLREIKNPRFNELQKITGAYQGKDSINRNQLLDAYHIWCAEHNNCTYFLTLDLKLLKATRNDPKILPLTMTTPSELLQIINQ